MSIWLSSANSVSTLSFDVIITFCVPRALRINAGKCSGSRRIPGRE